MTTIASQKKNRLPFGSVRQLPSKKWQARYPDAAGKPMTAPRTFATKRDALDHLAAARADRTRGAYQDHRAGLQPFGPNAAQWVADGGPRGKLAPKTKANNEDLLAGLLAPLHDHPINSITPDVVRSWYSRAG